MSGETQTFELAGIPFDELGPRRFMHYYDPRSQLRALVVIDTIRDWPSGGGVRMSLDLNPNEIARLARAMSYKYASIGLPIGGAKAGIFFDPSHPARGEVIAAFREAIRPLTESGAFVPGPDMGTSAVDFPSPVGGVTLDERLTGYGVVIAARVAAEHLGYSLSGRRIAIEGFGKVGRSAARYFVAEGARVVAVSTIRSAIFNSDGLDIECLSSLESEYGDVGLEKLPGVSVLPREALFTVPADVLVPGARPDVIRAGNVNQISAKLIVPGSNIPYAAGSLSMLNARGVIAVPDFVANAGGVLANVAALQGAEGDAALAIVRNAIENSMRNIIRRAKDTGATLYDSAIAIAREELLGKSPQPNTIEVRSEA